MSQLTIGNLTFVPWKEQPHLLADVTVHSLNTDIYSSVADDIYVCEINPALADTAEFCEHYAITREESANSIVVKAKRAERKWYAMCSILATTRADINSVVRKHLVAKGVSFAPMDEATELTTMEFGGIGPIGIDLQWPLLIDSRVVDQEYVVVGSGIRGSKIALPGKALASLPNGVVLKDMATVSS